MRRKRKKNEKKRSIALAAIELFAQNGLEKTSVDMIAAKANIGKGTVYLYFEKKEEILIEIWSYAQELMKNYYELNLSNTHSYAEKINLFFDYSALEEDQLLDKLHKIFAIYLSVVLNFKNENLQNNFQEMKLNDYEEIEELICEGIKAKEFKEDTNTKAMAHLFVNMFEGTIEIGSIFGKSLDEMKSELENQRNILLNILRND